MLTSLTWRPRCRNSGNPRNNRFASTPNPNLLTTWGFICPRSFTVTRRSVPHHHFLARRVSVALRLDGQGPLPPVLQAGISPQRHSKLLRATALFRQATLAPRHSRPPKLLARHFRRLRNVAVTAFCLARDSQPHTTVKPTSPRGPPCHTQ